MMFWGPPPVSEHTRLAKEPALDKCKSEEEWKAQLRPTAFQVKSCLNLIISKGGFPCSSPEGLFGSQWVRSGGMVAVAVDESRKPRMRCDAMRYLGSVQVYPVTRKKWSGHGRIRAVFGALPLSSTRRGFVAVSVAMSTGWVDP